MSYVKGGPGMPRKRLPGPGPGHAARWNPGGPPPASGTRRGGCGWWLIAALAWAVLAVLIAWRWPT